eukprot:TRINITY_DN8860_c0_g1_i1.p1 TRINITY_DN8860_c0_g1~~TRINITY_DN8860_c0_g1_i1.p1  ORF type:complete len:444 (-),score=79.79 TRINITY_DN8860_c0_g1_i1:4-1335(-)
MTDAVLMLQEENISNHHHLVDTSVPSGELAFTSSSSGEHQNSVNHLEILLGQQNQKAASATENQQAIQDDIFVIAPAVEKKKQEEFTSIPTSSSPKNERRLAPSFVSVERREEDNIKYNKPQWVPDEGSMRCTKCDAPFSLILRRHHCRGCGKIFCNGCSNHYLLLPEDFEYSTVQRTCEDCYKKLSTINFSLEYETFGSSEKPTIVFIHGAMGNRRMWQPQVAHFAKEYHVIALDLPSHGARVGSQLTMGNCLETVREVIKREVPEGKKVVLVGFEMGGLISLLFAQENTLACRALICYSCVAPADQFVLGPLSALSSILPDMFVGTLFEKFFPEQKDELSRCFLRSGFNYKSLPECAEMMVNAGGYDFEAAIELQQIPILFIHGEKDNRKNEYSFMEYARKGRLHIIKGTSAFINLHPTHLHEFNEVLSEFLTSIPPPTSP